MAQQDPGCDIINAPATSSFNFTEAIARWGQEDSVDIDSTPYRVRSIKINSLPIFDELNPKENNVLYRWVNAIHFDTRPSVISNQLLFAPGDMVNSQILTENERILRKSNFISESEIRVLQKCEDAVDLEVVTKEVWTLTPVVSFHASGGDNNFSFGVRDQNLLGTGQRVSVGYESDADRDSYQLSYENPNIGNTYKSIKLQSDSNSDGHHYLAEYSLPFYALDSRKAWSIGYESTEEVLKQYRYGKKFTEIAHHSTRAELSWGFSGGLVEGYTNRYTAGVRYDDQRFAPGFDLPPPLIQTEDFSLTYPFLQIERIEDNFAVGYNISQIYRAEDLALGKHLLASVGYAPGSNDQLIFEGRFSDTLLSRQKMLLEWSTDWYGRWNQTNAAWEDSIVNFNVDFHRGQTDYRTLYLGLAATRAFNLNNGQQVTLGGSTGLRGFDSHYLNGDGSIRFTLEERIFTNYHVLQLFRVGFAGFVDAGRMWGQSEDGAGRTFSNIGMGLRLAPSKTDKGKVIHIDLAYPLQSNIPGGRSVQLVLEAKASF